MAEENQADREIADTVLTVGGAENVPACRLYERCGYRAREVSNLFHFWLNEAP